MANRLSTYKQSKEKGEQKPVRSGHCCCTGVAQALQRKGSDMK